MKLYKNMLLALAFVTGFGLQSCDETTTTDVVATVEAPTNLAATSINDSTIRIKFTASKSDTSTSFAGYSLTITGPTGSTVKSLTKTDNPFTITNLSTGVIYTFDLKAKNTAGTLSSAASVQWSPAARFVQTENEKPVYVYEYASALGSGLELFAKEPTTEIEGAHVSKVTKIASWNLGINTKDGNIIFGSASKLGLGTSDSSAQMGSIVYWENNLDDLYGTEALNKSATFADTTVDLASTDYASKSKSAIFVVRTKVGSQYRYAKVMVKRGTDGKFLQGTSPNRYVECIVSYQRKVDVPYAIFGK